MIAATAMSLDLFGAGFGPYPHPELRIVEVPSTWQMGAAVAFPGTIFFVEDRGFLTDARDSTRLDIVTRRIAHEVAHQWWGMQLSPAPGPGATMLVESFAKYGEQRVLAASHGEAMVEELMQYDQDRYLSGRTGAGESEVPLVQAGDESWLYYGKGGVVMNALRALVGQEALDRSLRRLLQEHGGPNGLATAADFLDILHEEVPEEYHAQVDEWLTEVVLYDLSVPAATASQRPDGRFDVTVDLKASKTKGDRATALDETVDVAVYGADSLLALEQPLLSGKDTTLAITVGARPTRVTFDPFIHRLDRERSDNERRVISIP
jgi:aminopeptidase N